MELPPLSTESCPGFGLDQDKEAAWKARPTMPGLLTALLQPKRPDEAPMFKKFWGMGACPGPRSGVQGNRGLSKRLFPRIFSCLLSSLLFPLLLTLTLTLTLTLAPALSLAAGPKGGDSSRKNQDAPWKSDELSMLVVGIGVGDIVGDGENQIVLIDPSTVYAYKFEDGRLRLLAELSLGPMELKSVDVVRIRKHGPARIYVSAQSRGAASSVVIEYRAGKLEPVIKDVRHWLRVIEYPTKGPFLVGQARGMRKIYDGPIFRLEDKGDTLQPTGRFGVPIKIPIFGFAIGDLEGKHAPLIVVYDKDEHLRIYQPDGKRLYRSQSYYGGSDIVFRQLDGERKVQDSTLDEGEGINFFRPRIMCLDLNNTGKYQILTINHESKTRRYLAKTRLFDEGRVSGLEWNGDSVEELWSTPKVQGVIADFAVTTLPGMGDLKLVTAERKKTDWLSFLKSRSQVRAYSIKQLMEKGRSSGHGGDEQ